MRWGWEGTGGEPAAVRSTLESSPFLQLPSGPGGCSVLGRLKGGHSTSPFPPGLSNSLSQRDPLGKLRHSRGVGVPPGPGSAALTRNNLSHPACTQGMLSISGSQPQLELPQLSATNPRDSGRQLGRGKLSQNYSLLGQHPRGAGPGQGRGAWCCTSVGAKADLLFLCSFSCCSEAGQTLGASSQGAPSRMSFPADDRPKIYCLWPPELWESPRLIHQGCESLRMGSDHSLLCHLL